MDSCQHVREDRRELVVHSQFHRFQYFALCSTSFDVVHIRQSCKTISTSFIVEPLSHRRKSGPPIVIVAGVLNNELMVEGGSSNRVGDPGSACDERHQPVWYHTSGC